jgi:hypothetical protein
MEKREEKADVLDCLGLKCEVLLACIAENNHKKSSYNLCESGIPSKSFHE